MLPGQCTCVVFSAVLGKVLHEAICNISVRHCTIPYLDIATLALLRYCPLQLEARAILNLASAWRSSISAARIMLPGHWSVHLRGLLSSVGQSITGSHLCHAFYSAAVPHACGQ